MHPARRSRNQIVLVVILLLVIEKGLNQGGGRERRRGGKFLQPAEILTDVVHRARVWTVVYERRGGTSRSTCAKPTFSMALRSYCSRTRKKRFDPIVSRMVCSRPSPRLLCRTVQLDAPRLSCDSTVEVSPGRVG